MNCIDEYSTFIILRYDDYYNKDLAEKDERIKGKTNYMYFQIVGFSLKDC